MSSQRRCPACSRRLTGNRKTCGGECARDHDRQRAHELADEAREILDVTPSGYAITAQRPGTCPLCGGFFTPGRSEIVALAVPTFCIVPELDAAGRPPTRRRRRTWCHEECLDRQTANADRGGER